MRGEATAGPDRGAADRAAREGRDGRRSDRRGPRAARSDGATSRRDEPMTSSTPAARAAVRCRRSTSRPLPRCSPRAPACASRSTATARSPRSAAAPMCSSSSASRSRRRSSSTTRALDDAGIVFMFAPAMHPAMRHVGPVRRELGIPTVMNIVGPLANPAGAARQVVGRRGARADAAARWRARALGAAHAHGGARRAGDGRDLTDRTDARGGGSRRSRARVDDRPGGLRVHADSRRSDLGGGSPAENARTIVDVLQGTGKPAATAAVVLNAAGALYVAPGSRAFSDCVAAASTALTNGAGTEALERMRRAYAQR